MVFGLSSNIYGAKTMQSDDIFSFFSCTDASDNFIDDILGFAFAHFAFAVIRSVMRFIRYFLLRRRVAMTVRTIGMRR